MAQIPLISIYLPLILSIMPFPRIVSYYTLKEMLTEKYGTPECIEEFSDREPSSDFLKFHAILNDECHYISEFSCENGKIQLTMSKQDYNSASVILKYIDKANADETRKKVMDDL